MEFQKKQYDGPYEVAGVEIHNEGQLFNGVLYFPPDPFKKPFPLIVYLHGFPQLFMLEEIVKSYRYLLDLGFSFLAFNFRGYRDSEGEISIGSQVSDSIKIIEFIKKMGKNDIFDINNINIIGHDFGAYITLILCTKTKTINKVLLLSPIIDLKRHVFDKTFQKKLHYINRFLPGHVRGVSNVTEFIKKTKSELENEEYQIQWVLQHLNNKNFKVIIGDEDKITPLSELDLLKKNSNMEFEFAVIKCMDHECLSDEHEKQIEEEILSFFII